MTDWITIINVSLDTAALMLMFLGLLSALIGRSMDSWSRSFFLVFFSVLLLYVLNDLVSTISMFYSGEVYVIVSKTALFFSSLFAAVLMPLLTIYLLHCSGEKLQGSRVFSVICVLFAIYVVLLTVTQFTSFIYYFTTDNVYHRGPWYPLLLVPPILSMLALLAALFRRRNKLSRKQFNAFLIFIISPLLGMLIQMAFYGLYAIVLCTTLAAVFLYVYIYMDQVERYISQREELARQREELAQERTRVLAQQMRPHFVYNVLLSIHFLCKEDPEQAQKMILDFSDYLQQNFTAVVKEGTIPFTEELEHTRSYLAVEQVRYSDNLLVVYDTPHIRFRLPPLTLQPIVENAVRHGYDPNKVPLHITVRTRETASGSMITVEDDGSGYSPQNDGKPHTALHNIRDRLKMLCGGSLSIRNESSGGTTVTITIPNPSDTD